MAPVAILFGALLAIVGLVGRYAPERLGTSEPSEGSLTCLIPAGVGAVLLLCGLTAAAAPRAGRHVMPVAAGAALLGIAVGVVPLLRTDLDPWQASVRVGILMTLLCAGYLALGVRSLAISRLARSEGLPDHPQA
jgi:uncharacterized membrane protein YeaQ/YmgE (transglycosylase-associated protein family)